MNLRHNHSSKEGRVQALPPYCFFPLVYWYPTYDDNLLVLLGSGHGIHATVGEDIDTEDQYFIFMALKKGSTEITLVYKHSAPEAEAIEEKTFTVDIQ